MKNQIEFACFVNNTGFAHAAIDYAKSMNTMGCEISIRCVHNSLFLDSFDSVDREWIKECSLKEIVPEVQFRHVIPSRWNGIPSRKKTIALAVFESTSPPREWINSLKQVDMVMCPSSYCADVFWSAGLNERPLVVPHSIDTDFWNFEGKVWRNGSFSIFSVGTWRNRKNWKNLIKGCEIASARNPDIKFKLTIKTDRETEPHQFVVENISSKNMHIDIISSEMNETEMKKLIKEHDCLLSASIGEGFCIAPMQAMACGVPVICSAIGGCLEYALDENCIRIETRGYSRMAVMDNIPQFRNQEWAIIPSEDVAEAICKILLLKEEDMSNMLRNARNFIEDNFSYPVVGKKMMENIFGS